MVFPSLEDHVLLFCLQIHRRFSEDAERLRWILTFCDLVLFLEKFGSALDVGKFDSLCVDYGLVFPCEYALALCHSFRPGTSAVELLASLSTLSRASWERVLFSRYTWASEADRLVVRYVAAVCAQKSFFTALRYGMRALVPPRSFMRHGYNMSLPWAYCRRWLRAFWLLWIVILLPFRRSKVPARFAP